MCVYWYLGVLIVYPYSRARSLPGVEHERNSQVNLATNAFSQVRFCRILSVKCHQSYAAIYLYFLSLLFITELPLSVSRHLCLFLSPNSRSFAHTHTLIYTIATITLLQQQCHQESWVHSQTHTDTHSHRLCYTRIQTLEQGHNFQENFCVCVECIHDAGIQNTFGTFREWTNIDLPMFFIDSNTHTRTCYLRRNYTQLL